MNKNCKTYLIHFRYRFCTNFIQSLFSSHFIYGSKLKLSYEYDDKDTL